MQKLLNNPLFVGGALVGAYFLLRNASGTSFKSTRIGRTIDRVRDLGGEVIDTTINTSTGLISDVYDTGVDIWGIYDNDDVPDIDGGMEGSSGAGAGTGSETQEGDTDADQGGMMFSGGSRGMAEQTEDTMCDAGGFDGKSSRMTRGFHGADMDYSMNS